MCLAHGLPLEQHTPPRRMETVQLYYTRQRTCRLLGWAGLTRAGVAYASQAVLPAHHDGAVAQRPAVADGLHSYVRVAAAVPWAGQCACFEDSCSCNILIRQLMHCLSSTPCLRHIYAVPLVGATVRSQKGNILKGGWPDWPASRLLMRISKPHISGPSSRSPVSELGSSNCSQTSMYLHNAWTHQSMFKALDWNNTDLHSLMNLLAS